MIERFALADELTCYYDRPAEPANVHLEVRVPGRLDPAAVSACVSAVLASEPRIMARRRQGSWQRRYYWEFPVPPGADPVMASPVLANPVLANPVLVAAYTGREDLDGQRDAFLSTTPSLAVAPPLRFMLAAGAGGDHLILNAHHAAFDGLSCLRLMREVAAAYTSEVGSGKTSASRPAAADAESASAAEAVRSHPRSAGRPDATRGRIGKTARIAPGSGADRNRPGYGAHLITWDAVAVTDSLRRAGFSVNDLLIAALMITISDWNQARGGGADQIKITMPVGDKRQAGSEGRWANLSRLTSVAARVAVGARPADVIAGVASQTRAAKEHEGPQLDLASRVLAATPLPVAVKHMLLRSALRLAGPFLCDTSLVSNLGVVETLIFGGTPATEAWFSTSAHMPRGLSLGAVTAGGALRLTFRYRRALMSGSDAAEFAATYAKALDQFAGQEAVRR